MSAYYGEIIENCKFKDLDPRRQDYCAFYTNYPPCPRFEESEAEKRAYEVWLRRKKETEDREKAYQWWLEHKDELADKEEAYQWWLKRNG